MDSQRSMLALMLLAGLALNCAQAKPYFFWADPSPPVPAPNPETNQPPPVPPPTPMDQAAPAGQPEAPPGHRAAGTYPADAISGSDQPFPADHQLHQRIHGHLNQLVSHSSSAVKSVIDSMQPDLKDIRKDLAEAYLAARDNVNKKIEPTIHSASKSMAPLVNQAREEVPKALYKVGEHVKGVLEKVANVASSVVQDAQKNQHDSNQLQPPPVPSAEQASPA